MENSNDKTVQCSQKLPPQPMTRSGPSNNNESDPKLILTGSYINLKPNQVGSVLLYGIPIVSLFIEAQERLCLAQISNTLLKQFSYNEIHNRRVALGITCVQCTPVQLEILRRAGAMPVSSRRCGMITRREAERLCKSFLGDNAPPRLPDDFAFTVHHECAWGCRGAFLPARYNSSRAKCIKCSYCGLFFSPNKFIFHSHRIGLVDKYIQPDAANFNSWRRHMKLSGQPPEEIMYAWEDVKAMFNGGTRKRLMSAGSMEYSKRSKDGGGSKVIVDDATTPIMQAAAAAAAVAAVVATKSTNRSFIGTGLFPVSGASVTAATATAAICSSTGSTILQSKIEYTGEPVRSGSPTGHTGIPLTFSRSFMMDYMLHHARHTGRPPVKPAAPSTYSNIPNGYTPWMKKPTVTAATAASILLQHNHESVSVVGSTDPPHNDPDTIYNQSAFKPVINNHHFYSNDHYVTDDVIGMAINQSSPSPSSTSSQPTANHQSYYSIAIQSSDNDRPSSDDELVDIETTEDVTIVVDDQPDDGVDVEADVNIDISTDSETIDLSSERNRDVGETERTKSVTNNNNYYIPQYGRKNGTSDWTDDSFKNEVTKLSGVGLIRDLIRRW